MCRFFHTVLWFTQLNDLAANWWTCAPSGLDLSFFVFVVNHRNCVCILCACEYKVQRTHKKTHWNWKSSERMDPVWKPVFARIEATTALAVAAAAAEAAEVVNAKKKTKYSQIAFCNLYFVISRCYIYFDSYDFFFRFVHTIEHGLLIYSHISWMAKSYF